ncbi:MAG: tetratricopeptide repeat protein [Candidatus Methylomirabilales bacterium]
MPPKWGARTASGVTARDVVLRMYERRLPLGLGALAVLSAVLGWWGYHTWRTRQEEAAQVLLTKALAGLEELSKEGEGRKASDARSGRLEEAQAVLFQIRKEYASSKAAEQSLLQLGNIFYQRAQYENALQAYQEYLAQYPTGSWVILAGVGKGYTLEAQARYEDAAAIFRTLGERYKDSSLSIEALMGLARSLSHLDRRPEAVEVYRGIAEEYGGTSWGRRSEELMGVVER